MKIIVLGSYGMAGSMISHYLKNTGHSVTRFSRNFNPNYTDVLFNAHSEEHLYNLSTFII